MKQIVIKKFPELSYAGSEAINTLCTNLSFSGENVKVIMLTSCKAGEGKSFMSMNIMRTLASLGKKVAYVDADLRRSKIVRDFRMDVEEPANGLSHLLAGMTDMDDVIYETNLDNAYMVPIGKSVSNSLPLLNSERFPKLIQLLREEMDYVIVDAPPIGLLIDASQIARYCDGVLLIVGYKDVRKAELMGVCDQLRQTGCPILGTVINKTQYDAYMSKRYSGRYYGSYYYNRYYRNYSYYNQYSYNQYSYNQYSQYAKGNYYQRDDSDDVSKKKKSK